MDRGSDTDLTDLAPEVSDEVRERVEVALRRGRRRQQRAEREPIGSNARAKHVEEAKQLLEDTLEQAMQEGIQPWSFPAWAHDLVYGVEQTRRVRALAANLTKREDERGERLLKRVTDALDRDPRML